MSSYAVAEDLDRLMAALFRPIKVASCTVKNRVVMAPMTRNFAMNGVTSEDAIAYYRRRAAGGTGLILTEGVAVSAEGSPGLNVPDLSSDASIDRWRAIVAGVHTEGGRIMVQLWHVGMLRGIQMEIDKSVRVVGPSGLFPRIEDGLERAPPLNTGVTMTQRDIDDTIADCVRFSRTAQDIGFDGVEIHGAHGYLWDQFFWSSSNVRTDRYGGNISSRARFAAETIAAMKQATGRDYPIGIRFSQWKLPALYDARFLRDPKDLEEFLIPLVNAGVDFFDCSTRRYWVPEFPGSNLNLAGWTKKITGVTSMTVGSVGLDGPIFAEAITTTAGPATNLHQLSVALERDDYDLVGVGRALLANPDWANLIAQGALEKLKAFDMSVLETLH